MKDIFKIIKKHIKTRTYDGNVYVLNYQYPFFHFWKEFPVYFEDEYVLKDFVENAHIFNFKFWAFNDAGNWSTHEYQYKSLRKNLKIRLCDLREELGCYIFRTGVSDFILTDLNEDSARYYNKNLSVAYDMFSNSERTGIRTIEEKSYKLMCE